MRKPHCLRASRRNWRCPAWSASKQPVTRPTLAERIDTGLDSDAIIWILFRGRFYDYPTGGAYARQSVNGARLEHDARAWTHAGCVLPIIDVIQHVPADLEQPAETH